MKGREDDRRLLERGIQLNVMALQDSNGLNVERLAASVDLSAAGVSRADLRMLVELFAHATTFGSLIQMPPLLADKLPALSRLAKRLSQDLLLSRDLQCLRMLERQASILGRKYDAAVANPPYISNKNMPPLMKAYHSSEYPSGQKDIFSAFMTRTVAWAKSNISRVGIVTPFSWMYLETFKEFRADFLRRSLINSLVELETNAFEPAMVTVCSLVYQPNPIRNYLGSYIKLSSFKGSKNQAPRTIEAIANRDCGWFFPSCQDDFKAIPGTPIAYWMSKQMRNAYAQLPRLTDYALPKQGIKTGDNDKFLRVWHEVSFNGFAVPEACSSKPKWFPCTKGGVFRKWYGNYVYVLNWQDDGREVRSFTDENGRLRSRPQNTGYFFKKGITWSTLTSADISMRVFPGGFAFESKGSVCFPRNEGSLEFLLCALNSAVIRFLIRAVSPTMDYSEGAIGALPIARIDGLSATCKTLVEISRDDWNAYERSWNFQASPLTDDASCKDPSLNSRYNSWVSINKSRIKKMQHLEEENNSAFIAAYDLRGELSPNAPVEQITLTIYPAYRYGGSLNEDENWDRFRRDTMAELLSYATGCMMGRYSLDQPGLILADSRDSQAEQLAAYEAKVGKPLSEAQFKPDPDGILPVLDGEWFEDDIVARTREFLAVTFPESTVSENLRFIEESLGKDIRKYFCREFYKDHLQTYKKRPIYWMVQSPKKGFACLIYLHRYNKDTLNQVLNNYFRPYLQKLEARLAQLGLDQLNDDLPARERTAARKEAEKITKVLKECQAWEQDALLPLAQQRIELDLDDGVKVNYLKLQDVLATIPGLAAKED
jgi:hypothetical protein